MSKDKTITEVMGSIENRIRHVYNSGYQAGREDVVNGVCEQVKESLAETMKTIPKVVWCKDCKHCDHVEHDPWCNWWQDRVKDNDYCSYGKRSEE